MEGDDLTFLVVGNEAKSKGCVANILAQRVFASPVETNVASVRILSGNCKALKIDDTTPFPAAAVKIVDTTPFPPPGKGSLLPNARQWISQNSLRRMLAGKLLVVLCVVTTSGEFKSIDSTDTHEFDWLDYLDVIFKDHTRAIKILVNTQEKHPTAHSSAKNRIDYILKRRGFPSGISTYVNLSKLEVSSVNSMVEENMNLNLKETRETMTPFLLKEVSDLPKNDRYGPWGPERVILFGRTGSGKSTLAQMLTSGKLDPLSKKFAVKSSIRGVTPTVSYGEGRGWYVVDTPGFGEPREEKSTIPTQEAEKRIMRFIKKIDGLYSHFLFVVQKGRMDELEVRLWKFFVCLFGADISYHFSVVVSNADSEWIRNNTSHLSSTFKGCSSFIGAEFPSICTEDEEWENELQEIRTESLIDMENSLASLSRNDTICRFGDMSDTATAGRISQAAGSLKSYQTDIRQTAKFMAKVVLTMSCLTQSLTIDDDIALLPM